MQGDAKENFWPKIILVNAPVARHFVWLSSQHLLCHLQCDENKDEARKPKA